MTNDGDVSLRIESEHFGPLYVNIPRRMFVELRMKADLSALPVVNPSLLKDKLRTPVNSTRLGEIAQSKRKCVVMVDDPSRPTPTQLVAPLIIEELKSAGIEDANITLFVAKGTHKTFSESRLREKLGSLLDRYPVIQNESHVDQDYARVGRFRSGRELYVHKKVLECDLKIGVGQIILSPFAGFTGGPKIVLPGACNNETIFQNHLMAFDPNARVGEVTSNPVRIDMDEAAQMIGLDFIYNVTIDHENRIVFAACGDPKSVFERGVETMIDQYSLRLDERLDLVLYNAFPSDRSLYYTISKADIGELAVKKGGALVVIGSCREGIGDEGFYPLLGQQPEEIKERAVADAIRADWAGVSYRLTRILQEKKIVAFVPQHIASLAEIRNENVEFCTDLSKFVASYIENNPKAKIGYISSPFALPIVERPPGQGFHH